MSVSVVSVQEQAVLSAFIVVPVEQATQVPEKTTFVLSVQRQAVAPLLGAELAGQAAQAVFPEFIAAAFELQVAQIVLVV